jgi:uncharacterized protein
MLYTAFLLGLMGSLHCVGMCGPIVLALPVPADSNRTVAILLYNLGRILTYSVIGLAFGFLGQAFVLAGFQQFLSIASGIVILLLVFFQVYGYKSAFTATWTGFVSANIQKKFSFLLKERTYSSLFFIGMLNGLLPCGLVYIALAGATATGNVLGGSLYMALFGLGTAPAMFAIGYFRHLITSNWRFNLRRLVPISVGCMALLLIIRGLNLGIPYVSPTMKSSKGHCCTKIQCH